MIQEYPVDNMPTLCHTSPTQTYRYQVSPDLDQQLTLHIHNSSPKAKLAGSDPGLSMPNKMVYTKCNVAEGMGMDSEAQQKF